MVSTGWGLDDFGGETETQGCTPMAQEMHAWQLRTQTSLTQEAAGSVFKTLFICVYLKEK